MYILSETNWKPNSGNEKIRLVDLFFSLSNRLAGNYVIQTVLTDQHYNFWSVILHSFLVALAVSLQPTYSACSRLRLFLEIMEYLSYFLRKSRPWKWLYKKSPCFFQMHFYLGQILWFSYKGSKDSVDQFQRLSLFCPLFRKWSHNISNYK